MSTPEKHKIRPQISTQGPLTIALIAPSDRNIGKHQLFLGKLKLKGLDFQVIDSIDPELADKSLPFNISGRVREIHEAFRNPAISIILCINGGVSANELLPHLDYDIIREHPKPFIGLSDITLLHMAFYTKAGLKTFYGPTLLHSFCGLTLNKFTEDSFLHAMNPREVIGPIPRSRRWPEEYHQWLRQADPFTLRARALRSDPGWRWLIPGRAEGTILGGCLFSLVQVQATCYAPDYEGAILLIETHQDLSENGNHLGRGFGLDSERAALADLVNAGIFNKITGLVIGRPTSNTEKMRQAWDESVLGFCEMAQVNFPVLANVDVGHTEPMLTIPLGAQCILDSKKDEWRILDSGVVGVGGNNGDDDDRGDEGDGAGQGGGGGEDDTSRGRTEGERLEGKNFDVGASKGANSKEKKPRGPEGRKDIQGSGEI